MNKSLKIIAIGLLAIAQTIVSSATVTIQNTTSESMEVTIYTTTETNVTTWTDAYAVDIDSGFEKWKSYTVNWNDGDSISVVTTLIIIPPGGTYSYEEQEYSNDTTITMSLEYTSDSQIYTTTTKETQKLVTRG